MKITIVGSGFGGIKAALELAKQPDTKITVITDMPHFQYYPALYSVATGHSHREAWIPLSKVFEETENVEVIIDSIAKIDPNIELLTGATGTKYHYEKLILAMGSVTTYFGIEGLDQYSYGIKSVAEINAFKRHLYEELSTERELDKHYIVVGAGPTGVELASSLATYLKRLRKQFRISESKKIHIDVVEAAPRVLPRMSEQASDMVKKRLEKLGVKVHLKKAVQSQNAESLTVSGKPIMSETVIWTSGVANNPFFKANAEHFKFSPNGKVLVDAYMQAARGVYVIGDNAYTPFSGLAQTAVHDAHFVAHNIRQQRAHKKLRRYKPKKPIVALPVGPNWAIVEYGPIRISGWIGSLIRRAADFVAFHDVLPARKALEVWATAGESDEDMQVIPIQSPKGAEKE